MSTRWHVPGARGAVVVLVVAAVLGALTGFASPGPVDTSGTARVAVFLKDDGALGRLGVAAPVPAPAPAADVYYFRDSTAGSATFLASGPTPPAAQARALAVARPYARSSLEAVRAQLGAIQRRAPRGARHRQAVVLRERATAPEVVSPRLAATPRPHPSLSTRGALVAASWAAFLLIAMSMVRRRSPRVARRAGSAGALGPIVVVVVGALLALALNGAGPRPALVAIALPLAAAAALSLLGRGPGSVRALVVLVIVLAPLRGLLLQAVEAAQVASPLVAVNAAIPLLTALALVAVLDPGHRHRWPATSLLVAGLVIAAAVAVDVVTQTVGLELYAVGVAQYLAFPALALVASAVFEGGDVRRYVRLQVAMGVVVALSVFVQAAGITDFVQAAAADAAGDVSRYGGATGSYLHAGAYLGTVTVLALGLLVAVRDRRSGALLAATAVLLAAALVLTFGRAGIAVAAIGALLLLVVARGADRRRLVGLLLAAAVVAPVLLAAGPGFTTVVDRIASTVDWTNDAGNQQRLDGLEEGVRLWVDAPLPQQALGQGVAATGNASQLTSGVSRPVESYLLKLLVELGVLGGAAVLLVLLWMAWRFARALRDDAAEVRMLGAGLLALTVDAILYPTLEVQLLATITWVGLAVIVTASPAPAVPSPARAPADVT